MIIATVVFAVSSCTPSSTPAPLALPEGCNPLLGARDCFLPYPSDVFLVDDETLPSGHRVETRGAAKLQTATGASADITDFLPQDGFSRTPTIVAILAAPIADEGLAHIFDDPQLSTAPTSTTLIIDAETGDRIPHIVDLDPRSDDDDRRALLLRPLLRLRERHRYVVVLQSLRGTDGAVLGAPEGYLRLRDHIDVSADEVLAPLAARYEREVFPVLDGVGVARAQTQLAWDFTTGTDQHAMADMLRMRELVLAELEKNPATVRVFGAQEFVDDDAWRIVSGEVTGPSVMEGDAGPGTLLARDADGRVRLNGTTVTPFIAVIPASVRDDASPGSTVLFGHGFFGGSGEIESGATRGVLNAAHAVGFAIDWAGMSSADVGYVVAGVGEVVSESLRFGERVPQGMANWLTLSAAIKSGAMAEATDGSGRHVFQRQGVGDVVFDDSRLNFLGISQGHILGSVMTALNPDVRRIVLQVGGGAFTHMMSRASPFRTYLALLDFSMGDFLEEQKLIATYQRGFDRFDPAQYGGYILNDELAVGPPSQRQAKRVLMHVGIGDDQVPNFASWTHARIVGLPVVQPSARDVPLLQTADAPVEGSGLVIWDLGDDDSFYESAAPTTQKTSAHEGIRRRPEAREQMYRFWRDGVIDNTCGEEGCVFRPQ